jgi:hypothetical protein
MLKFMKKYQRAHHMKIFLFIFLTIIASIVGTTEPANAWGQNGHRVTAEIGEKNTNPHTKSVIVSITKGQSLAEIATWPDDIRSDKSWDFSQPWHFFSIDDDETWDDVTRSPDGDVLSALEKLEAFLSDQNKESITLKGTVVKGKGENATKKVQKKKIGKREALAFYVHFVGDVHQPLHVGRRDDLGGNKVGVNWFDQETNLHKVWDELLIKSRNLSFTELSTFLNQVSDQQKQEWANSDYQDWAKESKAVRNQVYEFGKQKPPYYLNVTTAPLLKWEYRSKALELSNDRLVMGGVRLAAKLDKFFSEYKN